MRSVLLKNYKICGICVGLRSSLLLFVFLLGNEFLRIANGMKSLFRIMVSAALGGFLCGLTVSCGRGAGSDVRSSCAYAEYFDVFDGGVVSISPYDGRRDTLLVDEPLESIVCMSSSHVACLAAVQADSIISAVSGIRYISNPLLRDRYDAGNLYDIGYEPSLDYERIMSLNPDLLVAYTVSGAEPQYLAKLRTLGIPVLVLHDHIENHPLARAEYVRLFGRLSGRLEAADSVFAAVCDRYTALAEEVRNAPDGRIVKVLLNIPYGDVWYIPGAENYMSQLIRDAGGEVLGAAEGESRSRAVGMEEAYRLSQDADIWLNPGHCRTREELAHVHQLFPSFGPLDKGLPVYNNILRTTPEGGNDFWESGAVRPDLVLEDMVVMLRGERFLDCARNDVHYFFELE